MIDRLRATVLERWGELGLSGPPPRGLSFHLSDDGLGRAGRAIVRIFRSDDPRPMLIAKLPRSGAARERAQREHRLLQELEGVAPRLAGRRFPRALVLEDDGDRLFTVQSVIPGEPLSERLRGTVGLDGVHRLFDEAREWLGHLWRATGLFEAGEPTLWEPFLRAAHASLEADEDKERTRDIESLVLAIDRRSEASCLASVSHGAFTARSLLAGADETGVVDWEHGRLRQFPWVDPLAFAVDVAVRMGELQGDDTATGFRKSFLDDSPLSEVVKRFLQDCLTECGTPADVLPLALPALALSRARRHTPAHPAARRWRCIADHALAARDRIGVAA